ncbi:uncharacterized protein LOC119678868 [Teleopsis dalmanni]|uniref:uncharacterized protein LOC119678868 n=1 Tax=Teleopsis dalmanni TaxID=139649 RepID=UPI0018CED939|nr:uncharacterized protein LOC119678868 [Teleopsis dalmanni]XP_037946874.1 uncharacterized protein LOC119678868 [Teleopsis dalmanni]XP_037946876.1 uncharacterized protein LOC119678868 [Teleopsis dalmanni]XP_037946877.1 uncharacterized protein LOC119678868 [Teleopsis dalmanni]
MPRINRDPSIENLDAFFEANINRARQELNANSSRKAYPDKYGSDGESIDDEEENDVEHDWFKLEAEENEKLLNRSNFIKFITNTDSPKKVFTKDPVKNEFIERMNRRNANLRHVLGDFERQLLETMVENSSEENSNTSSESNVSSSLDDDDITIVSVDTDSAESNQSG